MKKRNNKGFTLIELLIVVAIIGIIVAIAIPNLLNAIQRAKQKRTMADMRSAGTAAEAYAVDFNSYPASAAVTLPSGFNYPLDKTFGDPTDKVSYAAKVSPTYIRVLPLVDGWSSYFMYKTNLNQQDYVIASAGKNGSFDGLSTTTETQNFNADIIFCDGQFLQYPAGAQN